MTPIKVIIFKESKIRPNVSFLDKKVTKIYTKRKLKKRTNTDCRLNIGSYEKTEEIIIPKSNDITQIQKLSLNVVNFKLKNNKTDIKYNTGKTTDAREKDPKVILEYNPKRPKK